MARNSWVTYCTNGYGRAVTRPYSVSANKMISYFSMTFGALRAGYNDGSGTASGSPMTVYGGIWLSRPTSTSTAPDYISSNSITLSQGGTATTPSTYSYNTLRWNFSGAIISSARTVYLGTWASNWSSERGKDIGWNGDSGTSSLEYHDGVIVSRINRAPYMPAISVTNSYTSPNISITSPTANSIVNVDASMTVSYSAFSGATSGVDTSRVQFQINGSSWITVSGGTSGSSAGNNAGSYSFVPANYGVTAGKTFTVNVRRVHGSTGNSASASRTFRTYSLPVAPVVTTDFKITNANRLTTVTWSAWSAPTGNSYTDTLIINGTTVSTNTTSPRTFTPTQYVTFNAIDPIITIEVRRTHSATSKTATGSTTLQVRWTPSTTITNLNPNPYGIYGVLQDGSTPDPVLTWTYPSNTETEAGQTGIAIRYRVILTPARSDVQTLTYYVNTNTATIPKASIVPATYYDLTIYAEYYDSNTGDLGIGPPFTVANYIYKVSQLIKPEISYPYSGIWNGLSFRVAFTLPIDPDFVQLTPDAQASYAYAEIQIRINGITTSNLTLDTPFSSSNISLSYLKNIVFNTLICSDFDSIRSASTFNVTFRVRKTGITSSSTFAWSPWSDAIVITNKSLLTLNMPVGSKILKTQIEALHNEVKNHYTCYFTLAPTRNYVRILRQDFLLLFNHLDSIVSLINTFADYDADRQNVKFQTLDTFTPLIEIITSAYSANYLSQIINEINVLTTE